MARVSYLPRREGRYYLQVRCSHVVAGLLSQPLFRTSLKTADYRQARQRDRTLVFLVGKPHPGVKPADPMLVLRNTADPISLGERQ